MPNTWLTVSMITREALRVLHNNLVAAKGVNRQYSSEFAQTGAKIGTTLNVRKPNRYFVRSGAPIQVQNTSETYAPLTLSFQKGVDVSFTSQDLTCSLDDFGKRILTPAMARLASQIDFDICTAAAQQIYNNVGTVGSTPGTVAGAGLAQSGSPIIYLNAGVMLDNNATPRDENRRVIMNPAAQAQTVSGLSGLWQDATAIAEQYRKGVMGQALGFEFAMDQNINTITSGTRLVASGSVSGGSQTGSTLLVGGLGAGGTIAAGEKFFITSVPAVQSVNPENQTSTGIVQQFTVLTAVTADAGGNATLNISPAIIPIGAAVANGTVTNSPSNGATITFGSIGAGQWAASTTAVMNLAYHQDAITLATADLIMPGGVDFAARETYDGIAMRIVRQYDINNDSMPCRIDVLYGIGVLRPEMGCIIFG